MLARSLAGSAAKLWALADGCKPKKVATMRRKKALIFTDLPSGEVPRVYHKPENQERKSGDHNTCMNNSEKPDLTPEQQEQMQLRFVSQLFGPHFDSPEAKRRAARKKAYWPLIGTCLVGSALAAFVLSNLIADGSNGAFFGMWFAVAILSCGAVGSSK